MNILCLKSDLSLVPLLRGKPHIIPVKGNTWEMRF